MSFTITKAIERDAVGRQLPRIRIVSTTVAAGEVQEILRVDHIPPACTLVRVHSYATSGGLATRQPDISQMATGQTVLAATAPIHYQASATAKATQISDAKLGVVVLLPVGESLYFRLQPDTSTGNDTTDLYFLDITEGQ